MVNEFSTGSFMETHYHSQFDNEVSYDEEVYRFHHELYGLLVLKLDQLAAAPLDFSRVFRKLKKSVDMDLGEKIGAETQKLSGLLEEAEQTARQVYKSIRRANRQYRQMRHNGLEDEAQKLSESVAPVEKKLLHVFKKEQDALVRLNCTTKCSFRRNLCRTIFSI